MKHTTNLDIPENASLEFAPEGLYLKVCLPIPKELVKYVGNKNNIFKCKNKKINYYRNKKLIDNPTKKRIEFIYKELLKQLQINIRTKKVAELSNQINNLKCLR